MIQTKDVEVTGRAGRMGGMGRPAAMGLAAGPSHAAFGVQSGGLFPYPRNPVS
jgi:hypothetical protein